MDSAPLFLGIDFGTSQSSMAWLNPNTGHSEIIRNAEGEEKTPSVVYFGDQEILVGTPAEQLLDDEEARQRIVRSVKRDLAKPARLALPGKRVPPVEVAAEIFKKLKRDAEESHFHETVTHAVVTHPAAFDQLEMDNGR